MGRTADPSWLFHPGGTVIQLPKLPAHPFVLGRNVRLVTMKVEDLLYRRLYDNRKRRLFRRLLRVYSSLRVLSIILDTISK